MNTIIDFTTPHLLRTREEFDAAVAEIDGCSISIRRREVMRSIAWSS